MDSALQQIVNRLQGYAQNAGLTFQQPFADMQHPMMPPTQSQQAQPQGQTQGGFNVMNYLDPMPQGNAQQGSAPGGPQPTQGQYMGAQSPYPSTEMSGGYSY